jgi:aminoglycoside 3-N-acetyltransferase
MPIDPTIEPKNRGRYATADLVRGLKAVGIQPGDTIFSHIALANLGIPMELSKRRSLVDIVVDAVTAVIGPQGTFLTPTFTYDFCSGDIFDPSHSPSKVGPFGEALRKKPGARRSCDPIFSVVGLGPKVGMLFADLPKDCFGKDSLYGRLIRANAKLCNIGVSLARVATAIHHIEQMVGVPYRYLKQFTGHIVENDQKRQETWTYNVRILKDFAKFDCRAMQRDAVENGMCRIAPVGAGHIYSIRFRDLWDLCLSKLKQNSWYLARGSSEDLVGIVSNLDKPPKIEADDVSHRMV